MANVLAILQGKESKYTLNMSHEYYAEYYAQAYVLYMSNHVAIKTSNGYSIVKHAPKWQRKVR